VFPRAGQRTALPVFNLEIKTVKIPNTIALDPTGADINGEDLEALQAIDSYRRTSGRKFPSVTETLNVLRQLGWRKGPAVGAPAVPIGPAQLDLTTAEALGLQGDGT
jgi:hypothetical protein